MRLFVREVQCYVSVVDGFKNEAKNNREKWKMSYFETGKINFSVPQSTHECVMNSL